MDFAEGLIDQRLLTRYSALGRYLRRTGVQRELCDSGKNYCKNGWGKLGYADRYLRNRVVTSY
jgi:hypothetical protein